MMAFFRQHISLMFGVLILLVSVTRAEEVVMAPNFELMDVNGKAYTLKSFKGKPLILHFWGTWCPFCKRVQPGLDALAARYKDKGLKVVAISFNERNGVNPQQHLENLGIKNLKTLVNGELAAISYEIRGTPTTYYINRKGELIWGTHSINPNDPKLDQYAQKIIAAH